jgi:TetR/AcrR family transcriptional regulator, transcriptional repressor of bet genes
MAHIRMDPDERKQSILSAAVKVAKKQGFRKATRSAIAAEAGVTPGLVGVYFGGRDALRTAIFQAAIDSADAKLVRDGLDIGIGKGVRIPKNLRLAAVSL